MKGLVMAYKGTYKRKDMKRMIIQPEGSNSKETAEKLLGKRVVFTTQTGNKISGVITKAHGGNGAVLVRFDEKGLPGQALGKEIQIE